MTRDYLCAVKGCAIPNRHNTECPCQGGCDQDPRTHNHCPGCLTALALPGILICRHHHRQAILDLLALPQLDDDLCAVTLARRTNQLGTYIRGGDTSTGITLDQSVVDAKDMLRAKVFNLWAYVSEERHITGPTEHDTRSAVTWLSRHVEWLSSNPVLGPWWGKTVHQALTAGRRVAYRTTPSGVFLGRCPVEVDGQPCGAPIRHTASDYAGEGQTISCRQCGTTGNVQWWLIQITGTDRLDPVPASELPALLLRHMGIRIDPATIRQWVKRGVIEPVKAGFAIRTTEDGAYLYDPHDVMTRLAKRERVEA